MICKCRETGFLRDSIFTIQIGLLDLKYGFHCFWCRVDDDSEEVAAKNF